MYICVCAQFKSSYDYIRLVINNTLNTCLKVFRK